MGRLSNNDLSAIIESDAFLAPLGKGSGWVPQPEDERDLAFKAKFTAMSVAPVKQSLREFAPRIRDQGQQGVCTEEQWPMQSRLS